MKKCVLFTVLISLCFNCFGQLVPLWESSFDSNVIQDIPRHILRDANANYYVIGQTSISSTAQFLVIKYDDNGNEQWVYKRPSYGFSPLGVVDGVLDATGNIYVTGSISTGFITIKIDAQGVEQWVNTCDASTLSAVEFESTAMALDNVGNVLVGGWYTNSNADELPLVQKIDPTGTQIWIDEIAISNATDTRIVDVIADDQNNIFGYANGYADGSGILQKWDASGNYIWSVDNLGEGKELFVKSNQNVVLTGELAGSPWRRIYVKEFDTSNGNLGWTAEYDSPAGNQTHWLRDAEIDAGDNIYCTGYVSGGVGFLDGDDIFLFKVNASGLLDWSVEYNHGTPGTDVDRPKQIVRKSNGDIYVNGSTNTDGFHNDRLVLKYNDAGQLQWVNTYNYSNSSSSNEIAGDLVIGSNNSLVSTGVIDTTDLNYFGIVTVKFEEPVGIDERSVPEFSIYPNPSDGIFTIIALDPSALFTAKVFDCLGREIGVFETSLNKLEIDIAQEGAGIFILQIQQSGKSVSKLLNVN